MQQAQPLGRYKPLQMSTKNQAVKSSLHMLDLTMQIMDPLSTVLKNLYLISYILKI